MNEPLLEIVPNVSEGCDAALLAQVASDLSTGGAYVADVHADVDHHRSVFTVFGTHDELLAGMIAATHTATRAIDLATHVGVHPRVGAVDVVPAVPLADYIDDGGTLDDAIRLADDLTAALPATTHRYGVGAHPQHAFAGAARTALAARAETDGSGVTLVGVRDVLIAFNVELDTNDVAAAAQIAAVIRESSGGMPGVRALGFLLGETGRAQVSTNIERWSECGPADVVAAVIEEAGRMGHEVVRCELVGLAPASAVEALLEADVPLVAAAEPRLEIHAQRARMRGSTP